MSQKFQLTLEDGKKIFKGLAIALGGCAIAHIATEVVPYIEQSGTAGALVAAVSAILINVARKWLATASG